MSPIDNNSNSNNLRRVVKKKSPGIPFICQLFQQNVSEDMRLKTLSITNCWRKTEKADVSSSLDFFSMFHLNELSAETIAIFFFVSLVPRKFA